AGPSPNGLVTPSIGAIAMKTSGMLRAALTQNRCVWSCSSALSSSPPPATGTSAMPHFGHEPGPTCTISGCIGHVYCAPGGVGAGALSVTYFAGSAWNFVAQFELQKKY